MRLLVYADGIITVNYESLAASELCGSGTCHGCSGMGVLDNFNKGVEVQVGYPCLPARQTQKKS